MATGQVSEGQAVVIVKGVDALPVEHRAKAEAHLIACDRPTIRDARRRP
jgi:hypothetical protein